MSDNPAAFDALRRVAYDFVKRHGKDRVSLERACRDFMSISRADARFGDISDVNVRRLIEDVVSWTIRTP